MRVLYLMQYFVPPDGSWSTRSYEFARELIAQGHEVTVFTSNGMLPPPYDSITTTTSDIVAGVPCVIVPVPHATGMSFLNRVKGYVRYNLSVFRAITHYKADLVFASSSPLTIAIPALWAKLWHRIPMVFEVRDLWPELPIAMGVLKNPVFKGLARGLEWLAYHASAHVVALSPGMAAGVQSRHISPDRITTIPNFSDLTLFSQVSKDPNPFRQKLKLAPDQPLVTYAGSFGLLNDVAYLVDVAHEMLTLNPAVRFLIIGDGFHKDHVLQRAKDKQVLDNNLWIWGWIPKSQMPDLLAAATVTTSLFVPLEPMWKNSANKFFDALASSTPIAINYGGWQADLINETGSGLVMPPGDPQTGARLLAEFIQAPDRLEKAAQKARELAETRFSRDEAARKFVAVLEKTAQAKTRKKL